MARRPPPTAGRRRPPRSRARLTRRPTRPAPSGKTRRPRPKAGLDHAKTRAYTEFAVAERSFFQGRGNMYRHLLITVDGSPLSDSVFQRSIVFAKEMNAAVTVLRAIPEDHLLVYQAEMLGTAQGYHRPGAQERAGLPGRAGGAGPQCAGALLLPGGGQRPPACRHRRHRQGAGLRSHHHGLAWTPRHDRLPAGQRNPARAGADQLPVLVLR